LVEAELARDLLLGCRIDESSRGEENVNDISGDQSQENKDYDGHPKQGQEGRDNALEEIDVHAFYLSNQTSCMRP
jgi:hypothetical protein